MRSSRRAVVAALAAWPLAVSAQSGATPGWPARPLRVLVGFPPGQASDIIARAYAEELGKSLGQPVIVENRPGAGATIAAEMGARAPADGYTLLYSSSGPLAIAPHMYAKLNYDSIRDFEPLYQGGIVPYILVVNSASPYKTLQELVAQGRGANGAAINYGSGGNGTTSHLAMEMLKAEGGLKFTHVPYKGSVPALNDLAAGAVQVVLETVSATLPYVKNGKARILGISMTRRHPELPDVAPIAEVVPGYESAAWGMFITPTGTPAPIVNRLAAELERITQTPAMRERLTALGVITLERPRAQLKPFMQSELERWGKAVKASGATMS